MKNTQLMVSLLLLALLLLVACAPKAAPSPQPPAPVVTPGPAPALAAAPALSAKPVWQEIWEKTLAAAKREGRLSLVTTGGAEIRIALPEGFKAAYGIPVEAVSGIGTQLITKSLAERRAGLYLQDIYIGGEGPPLTGLKPAGALDLIPPALILPDVTDPELIKKTWYQGELLWLDKDRTVLMTSLSVAYPIAINTNLVKEGEIKSWRDLLDPKWQGKIALYDPTIPGTGGNFLALADQVLGWDYFVELVKTKPLVVSDQRVLMDWVAQGKVPIHVAPKPDLLPEYVRVGAPVRGLIPAEGTWVSGGSTSLAIYNKPAHPNGTKLFVNWLLSKEGSTALSKAGGFHMTRLDVPTDHLPPERVRDPKGKYVVAATEEMALRKAELNQKAKPLVAPLMGK